MGTIRNATLADGRVRDVRIEDGTITAVEESLDGSDGTDVEGKMLLPGAVDVHVHFRQPGYDHKETWETGSKSAAAGGVTTVVDQPNTSPPTVDGTAFDGKADLAAKSYVDYGINGGVTEEWNPDELAERPLFALGEVFLADSTGNMGIEENRFRQAVEWATEEGVTVTVHAEDATKFDESVLPRNTENADDETVSEAAKERDDVPEPGSGGSRTRSCEADAWSAYRTAEAEAAAVERACEIGSDLGSRLHIAHTSTPEGIESTAEWGMTCEVSPHHLLLSRDDLPDLGTFGRMNPPLRSEKRRQRVFELVADGTVDVIATDHAPHTREEKDASIWDAPSGVPGVETMLPLLLEEARRGRLSHRRVRDLVATNPAETFRLHDKGRVEAGRDADLVLVDPEGSREIRGEDLHSNCGWTPFEGRRGVFPEWTMLGGEIVYEKGEFGDARGGNVRT